jgi:PAS domain-containing protein
VPFLTVVKDLVFIEEAFERLLLDYDRVFSAMGVPACLWRRTGEIYKANREFAELVGLDGYMMRDVCLPLSLFEMLDCTS